VPVYKKGDKNDCNKYKGASLLPTTYKILSSILVSRLIPYVDEITGDHQCGFRRNRSTLHLTVEKKWEYNGAIRYIFINFKKAYDSEEKYC
jgi:hypothetical protein